MSERIVLIDGQLVGLDLVTLDGRQWLVPSWFSSKDGTQRRPERAIWLDPAHFPPDRIPTIPRSVVFGPAPLTPPRGCVVEFQPPWSQVVPTIQ